MTEDWKAIQRWAGVADDGVPGPATAKAIMEKAGIARPASNGIFPPGYFEMLAKIESGNRPYIKARTSSASGLYQFIRSTWLAEGGKWGADMTQAFGGLKPSTDEQLQRARSFTARNLEALARKGIAINKASLYAAHFLGAGTAIKLLASPVTARADTLAGAAAARANPSILKDKTVGEFLAWLFRKTGDWAK